MTLTWLSFISNKQLETLIRIFNHQTSPWEHLLIKRRQQPYWIYWILMKRKQKYICKSAQDLPWNQILIMKYINWLSNQIWATIKYFCNSPKNIKLIMPGNWIKTRQNTNKLLKTSMRHTIWQWNKHPLKKIKSFDYIFIFIYITRISSVYSQNTKQFLIKKYI